MRTGRVRARWSQGKPALCTQIALTDPDVCEIVSRMGFDCIWLDLEHHQKSIETAAAQIRAARLGSADVLARPAKGEFMRLGRLLEAGARGILYPRCDNADEAREVVRWAKFAPLGERGVDSGNPDNDFGALDVAAYVARANAETFIAIQIESPEAVEHAGAIAAIDGVDIVFFGPGDFSVLSGIPGEVTHDRVLQARTAVCEATRRAGKHFATLCFTPEDVRACLDLGATFIAYGADRPLLKDAYRAMQARLNPLGFVFE